MTLVLFGGACALFVWAFLFVVTIVAIKAVWTHGAQILRTMVAFAVFVLGLVLVGCLFAELQRIF